MEIADEAEKTAESFAEIGIVMAISIVLQFKCGEALIGSTRFHTE